MEIPQSFYRNAVKALIYDEDRSKFLLLLESKGVWSLPGGGIKFGDDPIETLKREMVEETGLELTWIDKRPICYYTFLSEKNIWKSNVVYEAKINHGQLTPSDECIEMRYVTKTQAFELNLNVSVREFLRHI